MGDRDLPDKVREFWGRFIAADELERWSMLKELLTRNVDACYAVYRKDRGLGLHCLVSLVYSYFEDFEQVLREYMRDC